VIESLDATADSAYPYGLHVRKKRHSIGRSGLSLYPRLSLPISLANAQFIIFDAPDEFSDSTEGLLDSEAMDSHWPSQDVM
jgi:hypothetical protein